MMQYLRLVKEPELSVVKLILKDCRNINHRYAKFESAISIARRDEHSFELFELLIDKGADPKTRDRQGNTVLNNLL